MINGGGMCRFIPPSSPAKRTSATRPWYAGSVSWVTSAQFCMVSSNAWPNATSEPIGWLRGCPERGR